MSAGCQHFVPRFQPPYSSLKIRCNTSPYISCGFSVAPSAGNRSCSRRRAQGAQRSQCKGILTSPEPTGTAHPGGEIGIAHSSLLEKSLRLCAELLDEDNLVLPSALFCYNNNHANYYY